MERLGFQLPWPSQRGKVARRRTGAPIPSEPFLIDLLASASLICQGYSAAGTEFGVVAVVVVVAAAAVVVVVVVVAAGVRGARSDVICVFVLLC